MSVNEECKTKVLARLETEDTEELREAAFEAGELGCPEAVPYLADMLKSHNLGVQEAADRALRKIGGPQTVHAMLPLLNSDEAPVRNLSMDILREVGHQDFESLAKLLRDDDADLRIFSSDILGSTGTVQAVAPLCDALLRDPEVNVRYQAAVSLGELAFAEAAGCLNKAMNDEEWVQFSVIEALTKIRDESSVTALGKALNHSSDLVASMIIEALGEMGNVKAVPMLLRRMDDTNTALRNKIVKAIVNILGGKSLNLLSAAEREKFREYLLVALEDEETDIQDAAVTGLAFVGGDEATRRVLNLVATMNPDREHERIEETVESLVHIGFNKALVEGITQSESELKALVVVEIMRKIACTECAQALMDVFWNKERDLQREIVNALVHSAGPEAVDFFLDVLDRHEDGTVIKGALAFLGNKMHYDKAGDKVFAMLEHPFNDVKEAALEACIAMDSPEIAKHFEALAGSSDPIERMMSVYALGKMGSGEEHLEILRSALEDEVPDIRKIALEAIGEHCPAYDEQVVPFIVGRLSDENSEVRLAVVEILGRWSVPEVTEYLLQALADDDDWVRIRALEALGAMRSQEALHRVVEMLDVPNKLVVLKAVETLGEIGGKVAFRSLLALMDSDDAELTTSAEEAVAKIQAEEGDV